MKKIINIVGFACLFLFISCEKETEGISFETNYANFEMTGESFYNLALGTAYAEPGIIAMAGEDELSVTASNNIDHTTVGIYEVNYSATNADGFGAATSRTVAVYDPSAQAIDFSGDYISDLYRTNGDGTGRIEYSGFSISISKVAPGIFYVTDLLGGFYEKGYAYGVAYAMTGYIALNADNSLTLLSSHVNSWGDGLGGFKDGKYDPTTGIITWTATYGGRPFYVTLKL
ncbi:MAG: DUF5012 domain-containing protein [Prolixibacteraceae bacterium]|nr:DUF5012 domain-containing protein [Prolixibacteraceae bacterium]